MKQEMITLISGEEDRSRLHSNYPVCVEEAAVLSEEGKCMKPLLDIYHGPPPGQPILADAGAGEDLAVEIRLAEPVDLSGYASAVLTFCYAHVQTAGDLNVGTIGLLEISLSFDGGETWSEFAAGMYSQRLLGAVELDSGKRGVWYEVTGEDLCALTKDGCVTDIRIKPYGSYPQHWGSFRLGEVVLKGYDVPLPERSTETPVGIHVPEETLRRIVEQEARRTAAITWCCEENIDTFNWTGTAHVSDAVPMRYYAGRVHKGPPYTRTNPVPREWFAAAVDETGNYIGGMAEEEIPGMCCTTFLENAISRVSAGFYRNGFILVAHPDTMPLVEPLRNKRRWLNTEEILEAYSAEAVYRHYANAKVGDFANRVTYNRHVRVITKPPHVVYDEAGSIDPEKSFIAMTESGGTPYYYWQRPDGSVYRTVGDPSEHEKEHPEDTFLHGASCRVDEPYTFARLLETKYVIHTPLVYETQRVEPLCLQVIHTPADRLTADGLVAAVESNYRIITVEAAIHKEGAAVFRNKTCPGMQTYTLAYRDEALDAALKALPEGTYTLTLDITAGPVTDIGGEAPVTRGAELHFNA